MAPCLAVARLIKPHGLKGEAIVFPLTDEPAVVFTVGRQLIPVDDEGNPSGPSVEVERAREYHRRWLVKFRGVESRTTIEGWAEQLMGVPAEELTPPADDELYVHELDGAVVEVAGERIGTARGLLSVPAGSLLVVERTDGRELLVPFRRPIVTGIARATRTITLEPPDGLLDLD